MKEPIISIIIPCYNCSKTIISTLASVQKNKTDQIEIVAVDDCSTDNTFSVLSELKFNISNLIVIKNNQNLGAGKTRNIAISKSNGRYLLFLDSDDCLDSHCIDRLLEIINNNENIDILFFDSYTKKGNKRNRFTPFFCKRMEQFDKHTLFVFSRGCVWGKLIKKEIVTKNNLKFEELPIAEDFIFLKKIIYYSNHFYYLDRTLYFYNQNNPNSLMHRHHSSEENFELKAYSNLESSCSAVDFSNELNSIYFLEVVYGFNTRIFFSDLSFKHKRKLFKETIKKYNKNDCYFKKYARKYRFAYKLLRIFYFC